MQVTPILLESVLIGSEQVSLSPAREPARSGLEPDMLLFIDEIQALRYLVEERPQLAVVAAGSLLEFVLGRQDFSMPVGRISYDRLGPMSFSPDVSLPSEVRHPG